MGLLGDNPELWRTGDSVPPGVELRYHGKRVLPARDRDTWHANGQYGIIISGLIKPIAYE
jgi:hypothetical protein